MGHRCPCAGRCQSRTAGIGKQIQHLIARLGMFFDKLPVACLFGEQAGMLKSCGTHIKPQPFDLHFPTFGQFFIKIPLAAAFAAAMIDGICLLPFLGKLLFPHHLRVRTRQHHACPTFQFHAVAGVVDFIIFYLLCDQHSVVILLSVCLLVSFYHTCGFLQIF